MAFAAKADAGGIQIQRGVAFWLLRSREIGRAAAVTATHFQNVFSRERDLGGDVMIQLEARPVFFVFGCERDIHRRRGFKGVVQKQNLFAAQLPR